MILLFAGAGAGFLFGVRLGFRLRSKVAAPTFWAAVIKKVRHA